MRIRVTARAMRFTLEVVGLGVISLATATPPRCGSRCRKAGRPAPAHANGALRVAPGRPDGSRGVGGSSRSKVLAALRRFYRYTNARKRAHIERLA